MHVLPQQVPRDRRPPGPGGGPGQPALLQPPLLVWVSGTEVVVGYGTIAGFPEKDRRKVFAGLVHHLRHSEPLGLGKVWEGWSYGAVYADRHKPLPEVKWAQFGDWAACARGWYVGRGGSDREAAPGSDGWRSVAAEPDSVLSRGLPPPGPSAQGGAPGPQRPPIPPAEEALQQAGIRRPGTVRPQGTPSEV